MTWTSKTPAVIPPHRPSKNRYCRSLCLDCALAYGHLCFSFPFEERYWVKAYQERIDENGHYTIRSVTACERFTPGRDCPPAAGVSAGKARNRKRGKKK